MAELHNVGQTTTSDVLPVTVPSVGETFPTSDGSAWGAEHSTAQTHVATYVRRSLIAIVVLSVLLVATGGYSAYTYRAGAAWKQQALLMEAERDRFAADLSESQAELKATEQELRDTASVLTDTEEQLQVTQKELAQSEEDVAALEGRTRSLANEKAQVEDEREAAQEEAEALGAMATIANDIGTELASCVDGLYDWMASAPEYYDSDYVWDSWAATGDDVAYQCGQAQSDFAAFQARLR